MYKLENNKELTKQIKEAFKTNVTKNIIKYDDIELNEDNHLQDTTLEELRYVPNEGFIGKCVARRVTMNILNENNDLDLQDKEFEYKIGAEIDDEIQYINYGKFITQSIENDDVNSKIEIEALDYMCKFNKEYECGVNFPATLLQVTEDICEQCGIELATKEFRNSQQLVYANPFINNEQCREVLQTIAKLAFSWARVGQDNKLYIDFNPKDTIDEKIVLEDNSSSTAYEYIDLSTARETLPITVISIRSSVTDNDEEEGTNELVTIKANGKPCWYEGPVYPDLISQYGENVLEITEDYFAYDEATRRRFILAASELFGFKYVPITVELTGSCYLNSVDKISVENSKGEILETYCFNQTIKYNGALYNTIEAEAPTENETNYEYVGTDLNVKQTQIIVDKANQRITAIASDLGETQEQVAELDIKVDEINSKVSNLVDLTKTVTEIQTIEVDDAFAGNLYELHIYGNNKAFAPIYFDKGTYFEQGRYFGSGSLLKINDRLYDLGIKEKLLQLSGKIYSNTSKMPTTEKDGTICLVYNEANNNCSQFVYYNEQWNRYGDDIIDASIFLNKEGKLLTTFNVMDEYYFNYYEVINEKHPSYQKAQIIKRLGNSTVDNINFNYIKPNYEIEYIPYIDIMFDEGKNILKVINHSTLVKIKYIVKTDFTDIYATKYEVKSEISQTAAEITEGVIEYVDGNFTSSAEFNIAVGEINSTVTKKVGKNEIISSINQTAEAIRIQANKVNLDGYATFTSLSTAGQTTINGSNITTGTIQAQRLNFRDTSNGLTTEICAKSPTWLAGAVPSPSGENRNPIIYFGAFNTGAMSNPLVSVGAEFWENGEAYIRRLYCESGAAPGQYMGYIKTSLATSGDSINYITSAPSKIGIATYHNGAFDIYASVSDENLKENIEDTKVSGLDYINSIRHIEFDWKYNGEHQLNGYSAQQLRSISEDFVDPVKQPINSELDEILQVRDFNILPYITKAIQEEDEKIKYLEQKIEYLINIIENKED